MEIIKIKLSELTPDPDNAKDHPERQVDQIMESIRRWGFNDPIGIWGDENLIVEGHGRYEALKRLGYDEAECIRLDQLTDEERKAYALVHNQTAMTTGFIPEKLDLNLASIGEIDMSLFGFDTSIVEDSVPPKVKEDDFDEDEVPINDHGVQRGDVWKCGDHRVMCGDSSSAEDFVILMGGGTGRHDLH